MCGGVKVFGKVWKEERESRQEIIVISEKKKLKRKKYLKKSTRLLITRIFAPPCLPQQGHLLVSSSFSGQLDHSIFANTPPFPVESEGESVFLSRRFQLPGFMAFCRLSSSFYKSRGSNQKLVLCNCGGLGATQEGGAQGRGEIHDARGSGQ